MEGGTVTVSTILTSVGEIVTAAIGWVEDVVSVVVSQPLILLFVCIPLVGLGIGMLRRMISL